MTLLVISLYLALTLTVGLAGKRLFRSTAEDYFVATRTIGPFVLLMSLFGANMTAFSILGASGEAYRNGIGVFALMASSTALMTPLVFFFIGARAWAIGKQHGFVTQVEFFRARWGSDLLGLLIFFILIALIIPYLLIGVIGGGITFNQITDGQAPQWAGSLIICLVVVVYVTFGGLRGTAWVNTMQTSVFMTLGAVSFYVIVSKLGGLDNALQAVAAKRPELLIRGDKITIAKMISYTFIPLSVGMFPHIFMHWLSAKRVDTFKPAIILYPLCVAIVWAPSVLLGIFGVINFPDLQGPAANSVLVMLIDLHAPEALAGFLAAGVFAAIMSSLDSQALSLSTMFTKDIVQHYGFADGLSDKRQVYYGRVFLITILGIAFLLSLVVNTSIFKLGVWSFTGFAAMLPILIAALYWPRSNHVGGFAASFSVIFLWIYFFIQATDQPGYTVGGTGLAPVVIMFFVSAAAMVIGSLLGKPRQNTVKIFSMPQELANGQLSSGAKLKK